MGYILDSNLFFASFLDTFRIFNKLNVRTLYTNQIKLIGSTGGTRKEIQEPIDIASKEGFKVKV